MKHDSIPANLQARAAIVQKKRQDKQRKLKEICERLKEKRAEK